ncbi:MAG TPA: hypothetical protein VHW70_11175 [Edaphobacter sp.]|jgi:hypothetical protein|nr:hypothetical protein [Edaphobacter sp.]
MQVRFKTLPDPKNPDGFLVTFETIGGLVHDDTPLTAAFKTRFDLDSAFMAAGIYLRDISHPDPERSGLPDPEKNYEVSSDTLRTIGFAIPK